LQSKSLCCQVSIQSPPDVLVWYSLTPKMFEAERTIVITGGTGGIGFQSALGVARNQNTRVVITGRNVERGEAARQHIVKETDNPHVEFVAGDVSSISGVDALAKELLERVSDGDSDGRIDVLVNNVGYLGNERKCNNDGLEMNFAVNVLSVWRLTHALLPALKVAAAKKGQSRVLNVTGGNSPASVDAENLQAEKGFRGLMTYSHSKSMMESISMVLARDLEAEKITVNVVFPGPAATEMSRGLTAKGLPGAMKIMAPCFGCMFREDGGKSAAKAARSTIWGCTSPDVDGFTGRYFGGNMKEKKLHKTAYNSQVQAQIRALIEASESKAES